MKTLKLLVVLTVVVGVAVPVPNTAAAGKRPSKVLFYSQGPDDGRHLMTMSDRGSRPREILLDHPGVSGGFKFSPDGRRLVFYALLTDGVCSPVTCINRSFGVFTADANGKNVRQITETVAGEVGDAYEADWSPDGSKIIHSRWNRATEDDIWVMDADGSNAEPILMGKDWEFGASWSPDGSQIAFVRADRVFWGESWNVYMMDADGSNVRRLTDFSNGGWATALDWSPDGKSVVFELFDFGSESIDIYSVNADGTGLKALVKGPNSEIVPSWSPNGAEVIFASDADGDYEIHAVRLSDRRVRRLTDNSWDDIPYDWAYSKR